MKGLAWRRILILASAATLAVGLAAWGKSKTPTVSSAPQDKPEVAVCGAGPSPESISGSVVTLDSASPNTCWVPGASLTFYFRADSYTADYAYVYYLWLRFPAGWTVTNAAVVGTPACDNGSFSTTFNWYTPNSPNEVEIAHSRYQSTTDHCWATYAVTVTTGSGSGNAPVSWYWSGDDYGSPPDHPCSSDNYTPAGSWDTCDQATSPPVNLPTCSGVVLSTPDTTLQGAPGANVVYPFTLSNFTGASATFTITGAGATWPLAYPATVGPVANGASANFNVTHSIPASPSVMTDSFGLTATSGGNTDTVNCTTTAVVPPLWDQPLNTGYTYGIADQNFGDCYNSYVGDDFTNTETWCISRIFVPGDMWNCECTLSLFNATSLTWQIYGDGGGIPNGNPEGGAPFWTQSLTPTGAGVTITAGSGGYMSNTQLDLATPVTLPPGHWWLVFYPTMDYNYYGQYGRQGATTANGYATQWINPQGCFGEGTAWQDWRNLDSAMPQDAAFQIYGTVCSVGPTYDMNFRDQYNRSELCLDSTTGDYVYNVLTGAHAGDSFEGTATITPYGTQIFLFSTPCPPGSAHCLSGNWNTVRHTAGATLRRFAPSRYSQTLSDANYLDSPACGEDDEH